MRNPSLKWIAPVLALLVVGCAKVKEREKWERENSEITNLVDVTCTDIGKDAAKTFESIINHRYPKVNMDDPDIYVFVYDTAVNIVAHPDTSLVGKREKGLADENGKKFRDEIVNGALKNGSGWEKYVYRKPGGTQAVPKRSYYKIVTGSDGKKYVVVAGSK
jgi:polar amino acid transport system substrate-binding protein